jgi:hypothetical protein
MLSDSLFGVLYCSYLKSLFEVPKQCGEIYAIKRRKAGMGMQKMPTKVSSTDHYAVGTLSKVGFVEVENLTSDCKRMIDTMVVLITRIVSMVARKDLEPRK